MLKRLLLLIFSLIAAKKVFGGSSGEFQYGNKNECPPQEEIPKCQCITNPGGLLVTCKRLTSESDFQSHLRSLEEYSLQKLEISNCKASSIPTDMLKNQHIEQLVFISVEVDDASFRRGKRHFQGLENTLHSLEITKSFRNGHRPLLNLQLDHLNKLQIALFEDNNIPEVGNDWFTTGPQELSTLIFERNGIEELGDKAFASLDNLKLLVIAGNHINSISRSVLPKSATALSSLDLGYNKIRNLPKDIFSNMPSLLSVNLDYNIIHVMQEETWGPIASQITTVSLTGNILQCDDKMKWICKTRLRAALGRCSAPHEKTGTTLQQFCK